MTPPQLTQNGLELLMFGADWCVPCKATLPALKKLGEDYPITTHYVDGEANPDLMRDHHVSTFPTMILFKDGEMVDTLYGGKTLGQLHTFVGRHL